MANLKENRKDKEQPGFRIAVESRREESFLPMKIAVGIVLDLRSIRIKIDF